MKGAKAGDLFRAFLMAGALGVTKTRLKQNRTCGRFFSGAVHGDMPEPQTVVLGGRASTAQGISAIVRWFSPRAQDRHASTNPITDREALFAPKMPLADGVSDSS